MKSRFLRFLQFAIWDFADGEWGNKVGFRGFRELGILYSRNADFSVHFGGSITLNAHTYAPPFSAPLRAFYALCLAFMHGLCTLCTRYAPRGCQDFGKHGFSGELPPRCPCDALHGYLWLLRPVDLLRLSGALQCSVAPSSASPALPCLSGAPGLSCASQSLSASQASARASSIETWAVPS